MPDAIAAPGETVVATPCAAGAQVYECKTDAGGKLRVAVRRPIATLPWRARPWAGTDAGPTWEHGDGSCRLKQGGWAARRRPPPNYTSRGSGSRHFTERRGSGALSGRDGSPAHPHAGRRRRRRLREGSARIGASPMRPTTCSSGGTGEARGGRMCSEHQDAVQLHTARHRGSAPPHFAQVLQRFASQRFAIHLRTPTKSGVDRAVEEAARAARELLDLLVHRAGARSCSPPRRRRLRARAADRFPATRAAVLAGRAAARGSISAGPGAPAPSAE